MPCIWPERSEQLHRTISSRKSALSCFVSAICDIRRAPRLDTRELDIVGDQVTRVVPGVALGVAWRVDAECVGQDGGAGGVGGCSLGR